MFKLLWHSWKEGAVESHLYAYKDNCLHWKRNKLDFKYEFHGWGVTDKGKRLGFYFCLIQYMLNSIKFFKDLVFAAAFLIEE